MTFKTQFSLFGQRGKRKYLNSKERQIFYQNAMTLPLQRRLFCLMLYYTGARLSEISNLKVDQIDFIDKTVIIRTLKRRRKDVYRQIPLSDLLLVGLKEHINVRKKESREDDISLWSFSTRTGSRIIKNMMTLSAIEGINASALGLRHGFAVEAVTRVPLTLVQSWMGHAYLSTTSIYLQVSGLEERVWAEKMWES